MGLRGDEKKWSPRVPEWFGRSKPHEVFERERKGDAREAWKVSAVKYVLPEGGQ